MNKDANFLLKKNIDKANAIIEKEIMINKINENKKDNENNINNVRQKRKPQEEKERENGNKRYQNKIRSKQNYLALTHLCTICLFNFPHRKLPDSHLGTPGSLGLGDPPCPSLSN